MPQMPSSPPSIPPRNHSTPEQRRSRIGKENRKKTISPSHSPEVISNLIDSLTNISFPDPTEGGGSGAESRGSSKHPTPNIQQVSSFESMSTINGAGTITAPGSGRVIQLPMRSSSQTATELDVLKDHLSMNLHQLIDDAAEPPVVRTTKPRTAPLQNTRGKLKKEGYGLGLFGTGRESTSSLVSVGSSGGEESRGGISGLLSRRRSIRRASDASLTFSDLEGQKSPVSPRSPIKAAFNIVVSSKSERRKETIGRNGDPRSPTKIALGAVAEQPSPVSPDSQELESGMLMEDLFIPALTSKREGKKVRLTERPVAVVPHPSVPNRRSSLVKDSLSVAKKGSSSRSPSTSPNLVIGAFKADKPEPKVLLSKSSFSLLDGEDTDVTKRIKELKAKKEQREREARNSPSPSPASPTAPDFRINGLAPPTLRPNGSNTSTSRRKRPQDIRIPADRDNRNGENAAATSMSPDADEPNTPLTPTPLPINYSYVVKSLDDDRPASQHSESSPEEKGRNTWRRSMGSKSLFTGKNGDAEGTRISIDQTATRAVNRSSSLPRSKRWSHTDGSGSERRTSLRGDTTSSNGGRSVNRTSTLREETPPPAPMDPVVQAVDNFMSAKRLSQAVRHPLTGRVVSFSEVGSPKGHVVICCVGMGLTRFVTAFYDELAYTLNLRIITPDRPGIGDSEVSVNGAPLSWPGKSTHLCDSHC
jgi:hypothetical protein